MRALLLGVFGLILAAMLGVTVWASLERNVWDAGYLFNDRWFVATFVDAYCGFLTFYVWVAYRERTAIGRVLWFIAIMGLGNIAMAVYVIIQLVRLRPGASVKELLVGQPDDSPVAEGRS
jgi:hypothetical protein